MMPPLFLNVIFNGNEHQHTEEIRRFTEAAPNLVCSQERFHDARPSRKPKTDK
jgi:hypothetical protein